MLRPSGVHAGDRPSASATPSTVTRPPTTVASRPEGEYAGSVPGAALDVASRRRRATNVRVSADEGDARAVRRDRGIRADREHRAAGAVGLRRDDPASAFEHDPCLAPRRVGGQRAGRGGDEQDGRRRGERPHAGTPSSRRHASVCAPSGGAVPRAGPPNAAAPSASVATGPTQTSSPSKALEPLGERPRGERGGQLGPELLLLVAVLPLGELGPPEQLAEPPEEHRLERADGQVPPVGAGVDPVARERAGEEPAVRLAAEPVRAQPVRAVGHRDDDVRALARALALEQGGEDPAHRVERARGEIRERQRRQPGRRVGERARPSRRS